MVIPMGIGDLFKPEYKNSNLKIRRKAVEELIAYVAKKRSEW